MNEKGLPIQRIQVFGCVVGAKEKVRGRHHSADKSTCPTGVAAVVGCQVPADRAVDKLLGTLRNTSVNSRSVHDSIEPRNAPVFTVPHNFTRMAKPPNAEWVQASGLRFRIIRP